MGCRVSGNRDGYIGSIDTAVGYRYRDAVFSVVLHSFSTIISGAVYMKPFKNVQVGATIDLPLEKEKPEIAFGCTMASYETFRNATEGWITRVYSLPTSRRV